MSAGTTTQQNTCDWQTLQHRGTFPFLGQVILTPFLHRLLVFFVPEIVDTLSFHAENGDFENGRHAALLRHQAMELSDWSDVLIDNVDFFVSLIFVTQLFSTFHLDTECRLSQYQEDSEDVEFLCGLFSFGIFCLGTLDHVVSSSMDAWMGHGPDQ